MPNGTTPKADRVAVVRHNSYDMLVQREAETLREAGFDVDVICLPGKLVAGKMVLHGVRVHCLPLTRRKGSISRYLLDYLSFFALTALKLTALHFQRPFACIQINNMPDFLVFATLIPRLLGAKIVLVMYEPTPELWATRYNKPALIRLFKLIEHLSLRYAHHVFAVTEQMRQTFISRGASAPKISVILNATDGRLFGDDVLPHPKDHPDQFVLICHGAIEERYGHDTMLNAVDQLKDVIPHLQLRILGHGSYLPEFLRLIESMNLSAYVSYLGFVPLAEMVAHLKGADVGIVAQKSSPYSNLVHTGKMYDYINFNLPVLASRLKSVEAYFDDSCLCYFEPGNSVSLANAILDLYQNPAKRRSLVEHSRQLYNHYQWTNQKEIYLSVYQTLLQQR